MHLSAVAVCAVALALLAYHAGYVVYELTRRNAWPEVFVSVRAPHVGTCSGRLMVRRSWPQAAGYCISAAWRSATPTAIPPMGSYGP